MLLSLSVKNLALIDNAEAAFGPGLNVFSGETGAGKSLVIGSLLLALGISGSLAISAFALPPRARRREPITSDFPAPVSPEKTLSPGPKAASALSINARFFTLRLNNII